jgi:uncharacterized membrane protein YfcA
LSWLGLDPVSLIVTVISVCVAGIIRGYSGFGFAMVAVTSISLVLPPVQAVPTVLILEVLASIGLVPHFVLTLCRYWIYIVYHKNWRLSHAKQY